MESFKDYVQQQSDLKRNCTIKFRTVEGGVSEIKAHIITLTQEGGREMITTDAGFAIGIDQILQINDRVQDNYC